MKKGETISEVLTLFHSYRSFVKIETVAAILTVAHVLLTTKENKDVRNVIRADKRFLGLPTQEDES